MFQVVPKSLIWMHGEVKTPPFSAEARIEAGFLLRMLQEGERLEMPESRPMPSVGTNCHELRIVDGQVTWRILYGLTSDAVVILEVFEKKTRATPKHVLDVARRRWKLYLRTVEEASMRTAKQKRLEDAGWRVGSVDEFLGLDEVESQYVEIKVSLARLLRSTRTRSRLTQFELAERIGSSQSRVAKLEAGDPSVSLDLLVRSLLAVGAKPSALARAVAPKRRS